MIRRIRDSAFYPGALSPSEWGHWKLRVDGLVARPLLWTYEEILASPASTLVADFHCEEGWKVEALRWTGVTLAGVLELAEPSPSAHFVAVVSGNFVACLPLESMRPEDPLLAYRLEGGPISVEDGGPVRLASRNLPCYHQVKRVERLELLADDSVETSQAIALKRIGRL